MPQDISEIKKKKKKRTKREAQIRWTATWAKSPRYLRMRFKDLLTPIHRNALSNEKFSRKIAGTIFQLWVGHAQLNDYLHRFKKVDSAQRPACGHPKETLEHYLLQYPSYAHKHWPIISQMGVGPPRSRNSYQARSY